MWAVLYENGMSLTTASEQTARSLARAEHQRGRSCDCPAPGPSETHPRATAEVDRQPGAGASPPGGAAREALADQRARASLRGRAGPAAVDPVPAAGPVQARGEADSHGQPGRSHGARARQRSVSAPGTHSRKRAQARAPRPARRRRLPLYVPPPPPSSSSWLPSWLTTGVCCPGSVPIPAPARPRSAVLFLSVPRGSCPRWSSRRSCTSPAAAVPTPGQEGPRAPPASVVARHQARRPQALGQPNGRICRAPAVRDG